jgi:hypothetical protein
VTRTDKPLKVLSVVGAGRSGTTVLASILEEIDGFTSAGELRWLWERGIRAERPCGCGEAPTRCPVWSPVVAKSSAALEAHVPPYTVDRVIAAQQALKRRQNLLRVLRSADGSEQAWEDLQVVRLATASACAALAETTDARVVVDTSKRSIDAAVVASLPHVDHYVLHLVRDPRAVVHSWRRTKTFTAGGSTRTMGSRGLLSTVRRWTGSAFAAEILRRRLPASRWMHLRYEDFAAEPAPAVDRVLDFLGERGRTPFLDDHTVLLHPSHIVAGNPSRFTTGQVSIRTDDRWRAEMPSRDQRLVEAMTLPLMLRYGYGPRDARKR